MNHQELHKDSPEPSTIQITRAVIRVGQTEIYVWHIIQPDVFQHLLTQFNREHPRNNTPSNAKQKIIKYANKRFGLRIAFKSKEAFMRHLAEQTKRMAAQVE
jgi:hypothetical protein